MLPILFKFPAMKKKDQDLLNLNLKMLPEKISQALPTSLERYPGFYQRETKTSSNMK